MAQAQKVSPHIFVVDSNSTDGTPAILEELGCTVVQRPFSNYSDQRNWAIAQIEASYDWQLHLDADEVLDDRAVRRDRCRPGGPARLRCLPDPPPRLFHGQDAALQRRQSVASAALSLGPGPLRIAALRPALHQQRQAGRASTASCTTRTRPDLADWIASHNRWSDAEAKEKLGPAVGGDNVLQPRLMGDARERTRFIKQLYYKLPIGMRSLSYFVYRYVFRLGFLDGKTGFYFAFFQALWFRMLVDAKMYEQRTPACPRI